MAFDFDALKPEAKRAAFAHMRLGSGARHKRLSSKKKAAVEHGGKGTVSGKLGSGTVKGKLSPADADSGSVGGRLPIAKARPSAPKAVAKPSAPAKPSTPDTPEARFDKDFAGFMNDLTSKRSGEYASMVEVRKELDARGMSRAEQDAQLKRMSKEGKLSIVPEDNRKTLVQEDHDAAINVGGEPNHLVTLAGSEATERAKLQAKAKPEDRYTGFKNLSARAPEDSAALAKQFVEAHGAESVAPRIAFLEKKKRLLPGERAQLAALKTLGNK